MSATQPFQLIGGDVAGYVKWRAAEDRRISHEWRKWGGDMAEALKINEAQGNRIEAARAKFGGVRYEHA